MTDGPFGSNLKTEHYTTVGPRVVRLQNIGDGIYNESDAHISNAHYDRLRRHAVNDGDVVIALLGESVPRACIVPPHVVPAIVKADCIKFRPNTDLVSSRYVAHALNTRSVRQRAVIHGVGRPRLNLRELRHLPIPLAPRPEQDAIVAEIEKHFTRLDAAVGSLKAVLAKLRSYKAAVMKAAVEGHLVQREIDCAAREGRAYESASELLRLTPPPQRPNRWASRSTDVIPGHPALAVGKQTTPLPEGWIWAQLVNVARMESGHTPSREHPEWWDGDIPWIGIRDARDHDGSVIHETAQATNQQGLDNSAARLLPSGTVCVSRTASVGYVVVMGRSMATSQDFVNWIPTPAVTSDWLRLVFSADREALRRFGKGSVHKTIYFPEWLSMHIAVPPLAEQERITTEVDRLLSGTAKVLESIEENLLRAKALQQVILRAAFDGELVKPEAVEELV